MKICIFRYPGTHHKRKNCLDSYSEMTEHERLGFILKFFLCSFPIFSILFYFLRTSFKKKKICLLREYGPKLLL